MGELVIELLWKSSIFTQLFYFGRMVNCIMKRDNYYFLNHSFTHSLNHCNLFFKFLSHFGSHFSEGFLNCVGQVSGFQFIKHITVLHLHHFQKFGFKSFYFVNRNHA